MKKLLFACIGMFLISATVIAQKPEQKNAAEIKLALKKLDFLGSVLYVAAHPDDENTRLIAYVSNEMLANTAYLAMTRGDGGQNLIGSEIREYLGIIRTQELLAARRVDGGTQMFTRANDFGYSKSPEETQEIWEREEVLSDVVWAFRKFQPDVIITRFPIDGGGGHGHHTTSAILAQEAFEIAGKKNVFPDQLTYVDTWTPKRLYLNTGRWWNPNMTSDTPGVITVDVGKYNTLLGSSYSEIAAVSRTKHKSQGFGSTGTRGSNEEYLEHRKGSKASADIFEGVDTSWGRVKGGAGIGKMVKEAISSFQMDAPHTIIPQLVQIRKSIKALPNSYWKSKKLEEVETLIADCAGLFLEAKASDYIFTPGDELPITLEAINRSPINMKLKTVLLPGNESASATTSLDFNKPYVAASNIQLPADMPYSQPYWLRKPGSLGMFNVDDQQDIGKPENDPALSVHFVLEIDGQEIHYTRPVIFKWNDPVKGEQYRPLEIAPPVAINIPQNVLVFTGNGSKEVELVVKSAKSGFSGELKMDLPEGWIAEPASVHINMKEKGAEQRLKITLTPPETESEGTVRYYIESNGKKYDYGIVRINYDHIPMQTLFPPSSAKLVKVNLKKAGNIIGYISGAGDDIPDHLRNVGYEVRVLSDDEITPENLEPLDAVVLGVRALNTRERLAFAMEDVLAYAENGGTVLVQYNTNRRLVTNAFAPYPIQLSRERVTKEEAEMRILSPDHPVLNGPNKLTEKDFEGWVQERGLYFPGSWDENYTAVISSNDPGEKPSDGGLLVAKYGKGYYIYTGYSLFRQLPAGVPGALKLLVNMVSLGSDSLSQRYPNH